MARKPRKLSKAKIKEAADRAEARAKGEDVRALASPVQPEEVHRRIGRPTKYDPAMCDRVRELGAAGKSKTQIAVGLGINLDTLYEWIKTHDDFSEAVKDANALAQAWWEDAGQSGLGMGKDFNATAFIFQVKNRFRSDYSDKVEIKHEAGASWRDLWAALPMMGGTPVEA